MRNVFKFDDRVWLLWAAGILLLPLKWIFAAATAAMVHEMFHSVSVWLLGGRIYTVTVKPFGVVMEADGISGIGETVCALAGPVGSFCLVTVVSRFPMLGICALVQGLFNCLPVYPLDGGRVLRSLLEATVPAHAEWICCWVERAVLLLLFGLAVFLYVRYSPAVFPVLFLVFVIGSALSRKRP